MAVRIFCSAMIGTYSSVPEAVEPGSALTPAIAIGA
jgi:hypothetical protein